MYSGQEIRFVLFRADAFPSLRWIEEGQATFPFTVGGRERVEVEPLVQERRAV